MTELLHSNFISNEAATERLSTQAVERWRNELNRQELALFYKLAGKRLAKLGYEVDSTPAPTMATSRTAYGQPSFGR